MSVVLKPIELALNTALAQDLETRVRLEQFEHRCIAIDINDFNQIIHVAINNQQLHLSTDAKHTVDLTITGKALTLAKLGHQPESLFSSDIEIHGDVQFAKQLRDLLEGFDFDWEAQLARLTGDTLAYPIAHGIRQLSSWVRNTHQSLQENTAEYLREEVRMLPDISQIKDYMSDIDTLRADFDRLEARIGRLEGNK
ncbi:MAG: SCP2 sterol-binding domain-containing protein [Gammaproteobacteria bacterium]|nr:SCP2 sterol-binding domain-containing protein [Gammaproteobacteria bacterium]MDH5591539.1 SCP2 sterol-binding domain-containing protein [Gammaproteobacteria bacterium]